MQETDSPHYGALIPWMKLVDQTDSPPQDIIAFNFGIFENSNGYYSVYLSGSRTFDPDDDDWAGNNDFELSEKYFHLRNHRPGGRDWEQVLQDVVDLVKDYMQWPHYFKSFLSDAAAITVGFDDGSLVRVK